MCLSQVLLSCTLFTCRSCCNPVGLLLGHKKVCGHKERQREWEQRAGISGYGGHTRHRSSQRFMLVIIPHGYMLLNTRTPQCAGLMMYVLCSDRMGVFGSWGWWWFSCCLCCNRNRGGRSHRSLSWHHKKHTTRYLGADWGWGGGARRWANWWGGSRRVEGGVFVSITIG